MQAFLHRLCRNHLLRVMAIGLCLVSCCSCFSVMEIGTGLLERLSNRGDPPVPAVNETVMPPLASITATTDAGTITIRSGVGCRRYYTWEGATRSVAMIARWERWTGSLGLYYPGPAYHWFPFHGGIGRACLEEGWLDFPTTNEALQWIELTRTWLPLTYRNDGLLVGFGKTLARKQLNVDVWQILIGGSKPTDLPGNSPHGIVTSWDVEANGANGVRLH